MKYSCGKATFGTKALLGGGKTLSIKILRFGSTKQVSLRSLVLNNGSAGPGKYVDCKKKLA